MRHSLRAVSLWWLIVLVPIMAGAAVRNKVPIAKNDAATTAVNTRVTIPVTANDGDRDGRIVRKTVRIVGAGPRNGKAAVKRRGTVIYTPKRGISGRDTFRYQVEDNRGALSNKARVQVTVGPVADAGPDRNAVTGIPVILNGSTTFDPDSNTLGYSWRFLSVPSASARTSADIVNPASPAPSFTPDVDGNYELEFTVTDGTLSDTDGVVITAAAVVITSLEDDTGPSPFDFTTKDTEPKLIGTAATGISEVTLYQDSIPVSIVGVNNSGAWSTSVVLSDGTYTFTATGKNAFGQESSPSAAQEVTVDATAPTKPSFPVNAGCFVFFADLKNASIEDPVLVPRLDVDPSNTCIALASSDGGIPDRVVLHEVKCDKDENQNEVCIKIGKANNPYRVRDGDEFEDKFLRMEITDKLPANTKYHQKFVVIDVAGNESCVATFVVDPEDPEDEDYGCATSPSEEDYFEVGSEEEIPPP